MGDQMQIPSAPLGASRPSEADDRANFLAWWAIWPRREAQADAWKAWKQMQALRPSLPELILAVRRAAVAGEWCQERRRFIPLPATWLRGERWADEFDVPDSVLPTEDSMRARRTSADADQRLAQADARAEFARRRLKDAEAGFLDALAAFRVGSVEPLLGWADVRTGQVLELLKLDRPDAEALRDKRGAFIRCFEGLPEPPAVPAQSGAVVRMRRA